MSKFNTKQRAVYVGIAKANHKKLKEFKKLKGWDFRVLSSKLIYFCIVSVLQFCLYIFYKICKIPIFR